MDREGNVIGDDPDDRWNDGIKALSYGLVSEFGLITTAEMGSFTMRRGHGIEPRRGHRKALALRRQR